MENAISAIRNGISILVSVKSEPVLEKCSRFVSFRTRIQEKKLFQSKKDTCVPLESSNIQLNLI